MARNRNEKNPWIKTKPGDKYQYLKCPYCDGQGKVSHPGIKNGKPITVTKTCPTCKGDGKLVVLKDNERLRGIINKYKVS